MDWFGAYIIGLVTAIGGGTLRDLLLDVTPFWMLEGKYFLTTGVALIATLLFKDKLFKWGSTLFLFDTIGLGLFTIVGITKSIAGLYALACVAGGGVFPMQLLNLTDRNLRNNCRIDSYCIQVDSSKISPAFATISKSKVRKE